jgi:hypothetical protein
MIGFISARRSILLGWRASDKCGYYRIYNCPGSAPDISTLHPDISFNSNILSSAQPL